MKLIDYFLEEEKGILFWKEEDAMEWKGIDVEKVLGKIFQETSLVFDYEDTTPQTSRKVYTCRSCRYQVLDPRGFKFCPYCGKKISYANKDN